MRTLRDNGFGPFYYQGFEILRRLFVSVRDESWQEAPPIAWISTVDDPARTVHVEARHTTSHLDVEWQGTLTLDSDDCSGSFELAAVARRTLRICRLGLVVLHPVEFMVGATITTQGPRGSHSLTIARSIAPQPIIEGVASGMTPGFSSLLIEHERLGRLHLEFEGELFELEDQRNWGDASFKTYCTPLSLGFPRTLDAGSRIAHRLRWHFIPPPAPARARPSQRISSIQGTMPSLGRACPRPAALSATHAWHHLRLDLRSVHGAAALDDPGVLVAGLDPDPHRALEIAVSDEVSATTFAAFTARIAGQRTRIARVLVYGSGPSLPLATDVIRWRRALEEAQAGHPQLLAASRGYFVEFNRAHFALPALVDGLAFPHTATVHSDDAATIVENVIALRDIADTARSLMPHPTLTLAPLALYYPTAPASRTFPPPLVDPWVVATLIHAAAAGVIAITLDDELVQALSPPLLDVLLQFERSQVTVLLDEEWPKLHLAEFTRADGRRTLCAVNLDEAPLQLQLEHCTSLDPALLERYRAPVRQDDLSLTPWGVRWFESNL